MTFTNEEIIQKINQLGLKLPGVTSPGGSYKSVNIRGSIIYVAIQFPIRNGEFFYQGRFGKELSTSDGYEAMGLAALNVLSQIYTKVGFENVEGLNHVDGYYQSTEHGWDESPAVVDGASDLFVKVLGKQGEHSRSIFGVHKLPRNFSVGLTCTFTLKGKPSVI